MFRRKQLSLNKLQLINVKTLGHYWSDDLLKEVHAALKSALGL